MQAETYFTLTNMCREPLKKGDQAFNCYGNRTNRYLLIDYGFAFENNRYDSLEIYLNMSNEFKSLEIHDYVNFLPIRGPCQVARLKCDQICDTVLHYLRSHSREKFFAKNKTLVDIQPHFLIMTQPRDLFYELYVFGQYKHVLEYSKIALELRSSYEDDLELLKKQEGHWQTRMAILYRSQRKMIVRN